MKIWRSGHIRTGQLDQGPSGFRDRKSAKARRSHVQRALNEDWTNVVCIPSRKFPDYLAIVKNLPVKVLVQLALL